MKTTFENRIKGYDDQGDMALFLTRAEHDNTKRGFSTILCRAQQYDSRNFRIRAEVVQGEVFTLVVTTHAFKRGSSRCFWPAERVMDEAERVITNHLVAARVRSHGLILDEDTMKPTTFEGDGINGTAVFDQKTGVVFVFEAGMEYVRLKTLMMLYDSECFRVNRADTDAMRLNTNGTVECDPTRIEEIRFFD